MNKKQVLIFTVLFTAALVMYAGDVYYELPLKDLTITGGKFPDYRQNAGTAYRRNWARMRNLVDFMQPYALGKGKEEIYFFAGSGDRGDNPWKPYQPPAGNIPQINIIIKVPGKEKPSGVLFVPKADSSGMCRLGFKVQTPAANQARARTNFLKAKMNRYKRLLRLGIPGAAWFRHQAAEAEATLKGKKSGEGISTAPGGRPVRFRRGSEMEQTYSLFSGGRALSENLQLDRQLRPSPPADETIPIDSIKGITTAEMDWKKEVRGLKPKKDFLARFIPSDQYAVFFPTFQSMLDLTDEIDARGTPVVQFLEPRSEDALTRWRYQRQLCLPTSELSRIFGPHLVAGVAFTGSDPYFRTGTDFAVLFESKNNLVLTSAISLRRSAAQSAVPGCKTVKGKIKGIPYSGLVSPDRSVCSYMASIDNRLVIVTNSLVQLERVVQTARKDIPAVASLEEYTFFRNRYKYGESNEKAFLVLSDAAIRKWCSPRWRIADSRRTRAAAVMAEIQAEFLEKLAAKKINREVFIKKEPLPGVGKLKITPKGVHSSIYGNLEFLTPISEIPLEKVTKEEARVYEWFRRNYQNQWRQFFDPIAIRFSLDKDRIGIDITVRPLIAHSSYREIMAISGNSAITRGSGDPHPEALIHFILSLDAQSAPIKEFGNFASRMAPAVGSHGLNWIGKWVSLYMDRAPFWQELEKASVAGGDKAVSQYMEKNFSRFPAALVVDVSDSLKLSLFLAALRAFIEQTAPGLTSWETFKYKEQPYVRIKAGHSTGARAAEKAFNIYYAPTPKALILTLSERVLKGFLTRMASGGKRAPAAWLGKSMCFTARDPVLSVLRILYGSPMKRAFQRRAWGNIPILNEWRRRFKQTSPLQFHRHFWQTKLLCPGGGRYTWNEKFQTMESTVFGHPGQPKEIDKLQDPLYKIIEASLGLTFEKNGLRARGELRREKKK